MIKKILETWPYSHCATKKTESWENAKICSGITQLMNNRGLGIFFLSWNFNDQHFFFFPSITWPLSNPMGPNIPICPSNLSSFYWLPDNVEIWKVTGHNQVTNKHRNFQWHFENNTRMFSQIVLHIDKSLLQLLHYCKHLVPSETGLEEEPRWRHR